LEASDIAGRMENSEAIINSLSAPQMDKHGINK
jgi:hypothetical protein